MGLNFRQQSAATLVAITIVIAGIVAAAVSLSGAATTQTGTLWTCIGESGSLNGKAFGGWTAYERTCGTDGHAFAVEGHGHVVTPTTVTPTTNPPTTTTPPTTPAGNSKPPAGGYFTLQPPGTPFPSDATCAALVRRSTWEPRPDNFTANHTVPPQPLALHDFSDFNAAWNQTYKPRITGNFVGTTDEIIQYESCRWNWPDDLVRAEAIDESDWHQSATGDNEARSRGHCPPDISGDPCPVSFGLLQAKYYFHPDGVAAGQPGSSYPWVRTATALNVDLALAQLRGNYDGLSSYLPAAAKGGLAGDVGWWFSGGWDATGGAYWQRVNGFNQSKPWLGSGF